MNNDQNGHEEDHPNGPIVGEDGLTIFRSPDDILRHLHLRKGGYLLVKEAEIVGRVEISSGQLDVALRLQGVESGRYALPIFEEKTLVEFAKNILRYLEPRSIDPESLIHQSLRRIELKLGTISDD